MMEISRAIKTWEKHPLKSIYKIEYYGTGCRHVSYTFFHFVILDGKVISRHKTYENALKSHNKNPFSVIKNAYDLRCKHGQEAKK